MTASSATLSPDDEQWLAALGGHSVAQASAATLDRALQQAAQLRDYFSLRDDSDDTISPQDRQRQQRMLAQLQRRLPADAPEEVAEATMPTPTTGPLRLLTATIDWLLPPGAANGPRYALAATLAMAAVAVPLIMQQHAPDDDLATPKSLHGPVGQPGSLPPMLVLTPQPEQEAHRLQQALAQAQVSAQLQRQGDGWQLQAQISPAQTDAAQTVLAQWGVLLPEAGPLRVNFQPVTP